MKPSPRANKVLVFVGMCFPLLALIVMSWLVHHTTEQFRDSFFQVGHTYKVLNLVQQTQFHLQDAETERRGYLLTGDHDYFNSYGRAMAAVRNDIDQLKSLVQARAGQQTNILALQNLITERLGINPDTIAGSKGNVHDALAVTLTDEGKKTMEKIGRVLFQMGQEEEYSLNINQQRAEADSISSQVTSVVLIGTVVMVLVFIVIILRRLEKLQQVVTICAWTGQVKYEGEWIRLDEYLERRFGLSVSHGLSMEAAKKMIAEIKEPNRAAGGEQPPGGSNAV
ncbi:MAG: CHASE3 domain-containing protein [Verrucomicrobiota bacterium]|jgi:CHASE3 domain sensor protein